MTARDYDRLGDELAETESRMREALVNCERVLRWHAIPLVRDFVNAPAAVQLEEARREAQEALEETKKGNRRP